MTESIAAKSQTREKLKSLSITLMKVFFSVATLYYCFTLVNPDKLWQAITNTNPTILFIAFIVNFFSTIICKSALIWKLMNISGKVSFMKLILINLGLRFYTIFLPRGIVTGIRWYRYRTLTDGRKSFTLLTFDAVLTLFFLAIGSLYFYYVSENTSIPLPILLTTVGVCLFFSILLACFLSKLMLNVASKTCDYTLGKLKLRRIHRQFALFFNSINDFELSDRKNIFFTVGISLSSYILFILSAYLTATAISIPVSFIEVAWARSMILLLAHIPVSIAGLGLRELGFVTLFGYMGLSADESMGYALISFGLQIGLAFFGAISEASAWLKKTGE